jgi:hypothetical protein
VKPRTYESAAAFKQALEQRLRSTTSSGVEFARKRQLLVFDRFLARVVALRGDAVTLKGGLVLELRLERARTTRDVDLRWEGSADDVLAQLQEAGRMDLGDFMRFEVEPDAHDPEIQNDAMQYEGLRFHVECRLAARLYGQRFGVDVAFGDPMFKQPSLVTAEDVLRFAGVAPPALRIYPIETHIAEKLHAYTMPRPRPNSRVRDLPDIALLATAERLDAQELRAALDQTFAFRRTHALPNSLPAPPASWSAPYASIARTDRLPWADLEQLASATQAFLDPVLDSRNQAQWEPSAWRWQR